MLYYVQLTLLHRLIRIPMFYLHFLERTLCIFNQEIIFAPYYSNKYQYQLSIYKDFDNTIKRVSEQVSSLPCNEGGLRNDSHLNIISKFFQKLKSLIVVKIIA